MNSLTRSFRRRCQYSCERWLWYSNHRPPHLSRHRHAITVKEPSLAELSDPHSLYLELFIAVMGSDLVCSKWVQSIGKPRKQQQLSRWVAPKRKWWQLHSRNSFFWTRINTFCSWCRTSQNRFPFRHRDKRTIWEHWWCHQLWFQLASLACNIWSAVERNRNTWRVLEKIGGTHLHDDNRDDQTEAVLLPD